MSACAWSALSSFSRLVIPSFVSTLQISTPPPSPPSHSLRFSSSPISTFYHCRRNSESSYITRSTESIKEGFWEEADDGFGSEDDELEEELGEGQNEPAFQGANTARHSNSEYERLVEEVEHLLEPKERDILQQNEFFDISKISTKKWSIFHSLGLSLQISLMDELLQHGWDIDYVDADGYTSLHMAVISKKEAVISHLLRKGANPVVRDRDGATALHYAVQAGAMQTVKLLIRYKADVNVADNDGWTPLHISMQSRSRDIAKVLLINGADKMRRTKDGKTPLDLCLCYGRDFKSYDLAKLLKLVPANRNV